MHLTGATGTFDISFDVNAVGVFSLEIDIVNNNPDENPYKITIQGTGVIQPEIDVQGNDTTIADGDTTPDAADHTDFGDVDAAGATVTRIFKVRNTGTADLGLNGGPPRITIGGPDAGDFTLDVDAADTVSPGTETSFTITFDPSAIAVRQATITINNNDSDENPYEFNIQGTGTGPAPEMDVLGNGISIPSGDTSPQAADDTDFGAELVAGGIVTHIFTIRNTGSINLNLTDDPRVSIVGAQAADFSVDVDANTPVGSGSGETGFAVTFNPGAAGLRQATISIANDDNDENPYTFDIQGTGIDPAAPGVAAEEDRDDDGPQGCFVGLAGSVCKTDAVRVTVLPNAVPDISQVFIDERAAQAANFQLGENIFEIKIKDPDGAWLTTFDPPLEICVKPTADELQAVAHNRYLLSLFHKHSDDPWGALYSYPAEDGYICAEVDRLSYFGIGVPEMPDTGFAPGVVTALEAQPAEKAYASYSDLWLEIPSLGVELPIVRVPLTKDGWDVSWLGESAGWLQGTAFPTWAGNTAITAHVWDADNNPGPFIDLHKLQHGDQIIIRAWGLVHTYEVRTVSRVSPDNLRTLPHSQYDLLTLITCQSYDEATGEYDWRLVVKAVLISIE